MAETYLGDGKSVRELAGQVELRDNEGNQIRMDDTVAQSFYEWLLEHDHIEPELVYETE